MTHALLGAYLAQSELGDYDPVDHGLTIDYIREFDFAPNQSEDLLERIMEVRRATYYTVADPDQVFFIYNSNRIRI